MEEKALKTYKYLIALFFIAFCFWINSSDTSNASIFIKWTCNVESNNSNCKKNGLPEYIYIFGEIDADTEEKIEAVNGIYPLNKKFPKIYINSPGGSVSSAIHIGRIFRQRSASIEGMDVIHPNNQVICESACVLVAAGAVERNLLQIGLHSGYQQKRIKGERYEIIPLAIEDMSETFDYFEEMGISQEVSKVIKQTKHNDMHEFYLTFDEPFHEQRIVKLGFRMREPSGDERIRLEKLSAKLDYNEASLTKLANDGNLDAAFKLSLHYLYGNNGNALNEKLGLEWLIRAANLGLPQAQHAIAYRYARGGEMLKQDPKKAVYYYKMAANSGLAASQNNLGWMYYKGQGLKRNLSEAIYWITRSIDQGEPFAYSSMGELLYDGAGFEKNNIEAYKWLKLAVLQLPKGSVRDNDISRLSVIKKSMSIHDIELADELVKNWSPLKQTPFVMRDKEDQ